jgi:hypothetical protein
LIDLDTAKSLNDAGLRWDKKMGDLYYYDGYPGVRINMVHGVPSHEIELYMCIEQCYWAPHLEQLLVAFESRRYWTRLINFNQNRRPDIRYSVEIGTGEYPKNVVSYNRNKSFEEAAAQVLLGILVSAGAG